MKNSIAALLAAKSATVKTTAVKVEKVDSSPLCVEAPRALKRRPTRSEETGRVQRALSQAQRAKRVLEMKIDRQVAEIDARKERLAYSERRWNADRREAMEEAQRAKDDLRAVERRYGPALRVLATKEPDGWVARATQRMDSAVARVERVLKDQGPALRLQEARERLAQMLDEGPRIQHRIEELSARLVELTGEKMDRRTLSAPEPKPERIVVADVPRNEDEDLEFLIQMDVNPFGVGL